MSNYSDFSKAVDLYLITEMPDLIFHDINLKHQVKYMFYRCLSPVGENCNLAEIEFYGNDSEEKILGKIIKPEYHVDVPGFASINAFDGDVLTYYDAYNSSKNSWVGVDFLE